MITVQKAMYELINNQGLTAYRIAKDIGTSQVLVKSYLDGKVKSPQYKFCKAIYDNYKLVVFPYTEDELKG